MSNLHLGCSAGQEVQQEDESVGGRKERISSSGRVERWRKNINTKLNVFMLIVHHV